MPKQATSAKVMPNEGQKASSTRWSDSVATIQGLMARVQEQLAAHSKLRFDNPALAQELKRKAEQHLELLMRLADSQQATQVQGTDSTALQLQDVLQDLHTQLDLEQQAMLTASSAAATQGTTPASEADFGSTASSTPTGSRTPADSSSSSKVSVLQQQLERSQAEVANLQARLFVAESEASQLQGKMAEADARLQAAAEELHEHRELQMAYDKQCQDLYRLRMQLQLVRSQGIDAASLAAMATKQHKQDYAWLMQAHRKEMSEAHKKHQELNHEVQQLRLKVLEQEQQLWSYGAPAEAPEQQQKQQQEQEQQEDEAQGEQADTQTVALQQQQEQEQGPDADVEMIAAQLQLQQLQASAEQLATEKQQLMRTLQDTQREQAVLLAELQSLRAAAASAEAAAAAAIITNSMEAEAAALSEAAAAAEAALKVQLQEAEQQRDKLVEQAQNLQDSLQQAQEAAAAAAAAATTEAAAPEAPVSVAGRVAADQAGGQVDTTAAVAQLKAAKMEMANLRVQLADARRELHAASGRAAVAEAALQQQAADFEARLSKLQAWYNKQAAVVAQLRSGKAPNDGQVGFTNTNKFWMPQQLLYEFLKHWVTREALLQQQEGFLGLQVQPGTSLTVDGGAEVTVSTLWETIPAWEQWSKSVAGTQQHMPTGVFQYVPAKGAGFCEAFVPFRDYDEAVNAKY